MPATQRGRNSRRVQLQNGSFEPPSLIESPKHKGIDNIAESIVQQILLAPRSAFWEVSHSLPVSVKPRTLHLDVQADPRFHKSDKPTTRALNNTEHRQPWERLILGGLFS